MERRTGAKRGNFMSDLIIFLTFGDWNITTALFMSFVSTGLLIYIVEIDSFVLKYLIIRLYTDFILRLNESDVLLTLLFIFRSQISLAFL